MNFLQRITHTKHFKKIIIITFLILSSLAWLSLWIYGQYYVSTDNAYVNANIVQIAPRITGKVITLHVENNQYVKKNQPLFDIDSEPFQLAIASAEAQVAMNEARLTESSLTAKRVLALVKRKYLSPQEGDTAIANLKTAMSQLAYAKAGLEQARLNQQYTTIVAPVSGWVTNVTLREGDIIIANQPLFALVSDQAFWVDANFKETEMKAIKAGQTATIITDLYPDHPFHGIVESISSGAGAAFSLLPPQNATGNWVKVTQRVPVRIKILDANAQYQLRIGTSATATVHLKETKHQAL